MAQASLRARLLRRLLPALFVLLLAGAVTGYGVALHSATKAYDRALLDTTLAIAEQLRVVDGKPLLPLTAQARAILVVDKFDKVFYAVRGPAGELLDGEAGLPVPGLAQLPRLRSEEGRTYYDGEVGRQRVRVAALNLEIGGQQLTVLAAETLVKRNALVREVLLGMLLPELLLVLASAAVVWFGVRSGLASLTDVRQELAGRSQSALSPLQVEVPEEIEPVIGELNGLLRRLQLALDSQRNFVSDAAHQLRTPIAALQAQAEAAIGESPPDMRSRLEGVMSAARRLSHLVDQLLALARAEPSAALASEEIALEALIHQVAEAWLPAAIARGVDLGFEIELVRVRGSALLLGELLGNLLDNAIRHAPAGGVVNVGCGRQGGTAWIAVEDDGPGLAEEDRERIFERFYQARRSPGEGSGLGLAIVRQIARQHGGEVAAASSVRLGGAELRVTLPAVGG
jgi:two-component system sensor histidine kinase TctE